MQTLTPPVPLGQDTTDEVSPPYVPLDANTTLEGHHDRAGGALPVYTEADEGTLMERIHAMQALNPAYFHLPLTKLEGPNVTEERELSQEDFKLRAATRKLQRDIVDAFYDAIKDRHPEIVSDIVSKGLVSPDVTSAEFSFPHPARRPLLAAVKAGDASMVRLLVSLGSTVDLFGPCNLSDKPPRQTAELTALQLAAALGRLSLVKVLREEFGADDALVAPKGETALWLARRYKHREIVEYLPMNRAGGWLRFKSAREREYQRMRYAVHDSIMLQILWGIFVRLPRFLVYRFPRGVWRRRHLITDWCKRQVTKFPERCKRVIKTVARCARNLPTVIRDVVTGTCKAIWKFIKAIPGALAVFFAWIWKGLQAVGGAIANVVKRVLAVIHTAFSAVADFFRSITFQDVVNGVKAVLEAVFVTFPKTVWSFVANFGDMAWKFAKKFPGYLGVVVYALGACLWWVAKWPVQAGWKVLCAVGRLFAKVYDEIVICFNPKRM